MTSLSPLTGVPAFCVSLVAVGEVESCFDPHCLRFGVFVTHWLWVWDWGVRCNALHSPSRS